MPLSIRQIIPWVICHTGLSWSFEKGIAVLHCVIKQRQSLYFVYLSFLRGFWRSWNLVRRRAYLGCLTEVDFVSGNEYFEIWVDLLFFLLLIRLFWSLTNPPCSKLTSFFSVMNNVLHLFQRRLFFLFIVLIAVFAWLDLIDKLAFYFVRVPSVDQKFCLKRVFVTSVNVFVKYGV